MLETENQIDLYDDVSNPLDGIEEIMLNNDWSFDRHTEDEMSVTLSGQYGHYKMAFVWQDDFSAMQFYCAPDLSISQNNMMSAMQVVNKINATLWLGHFDIDSDGAESPNLAPRFRHTSLFRDMTGTSGFSHMEDLIDIAIHECERFYPCFDLLSRQENVSAKDISLALMDVAGLS